MSKQAARDEVGDAAFALFTAMEFDDDATAGAILDEWQDNPRAMAEMLGMYQGICGRLMRIVADGTGVSVEAQVRNLGAYFASHPFEESS